LHPGNMGFRHFANLRVGDRYQIEGLALTPGTALQVPLASVPDVSKISEIIFLLMADAATPSVPAVVGLSNFVVPPENNPAIRFQQLPAKWWALRIQGKALATNKSLTLTLRVKDPLFLADIFVVSDSQAISLRPQLFTSPTVRQAMPFITARWARAEAQVLLPASAGQPGLLLMLFEPPLGNSKGVTTRLTLSAGALLPATSNNVEPGRWQWLVWPYPVSTSTTDVAWVTLNTEPAWNSGQAGFPQDLGVLIGHIVVLPPL